MSSDALVTVPKETGQAAKTLNARNVAKMYSRLMVLAGDSPFWLITSELLPELMVMTIGDRPIWTPPNGYMDAPGGFLLGKPVRISEYASAAGAAGDIQLVSPGGYYAARRSQSENFQTSMHLYFDYAKTAFRWQFRIGGQPHLSKPVTPAKGSATKSHFVTLAARD
jgi:HK97 family phage major capsid protein